MMKQELEQMRHLKMEIRSLEIAMLNPKRRLVADYYKDYKHGKPMIKTLSGLEDLGLAQSRLGEELKRKQKNLFDIFLEFEKWLENIESAETRAILRLYYVCEYTQAEIAEEIGLERETVSRKLSMFWNVIKR